MRTIFAYRFRQFFGRKPPLFIGKLHCVDGSGERTHDLRDAVIFFILEDAHDENELLPCKVILDCLSKPLSRRFIMSTVEDEDRRLSDTGKSSLPESMCRSVLYRLLTDRISVSIEETDDLEGSTEIICLVSAR